METDIYFNANQWDEHKTGQELEFSLTFRQHSIYIFYNSI